jgi:hypothetical protein
MTSLGTEPKTFQLAVQRLIQYAEEHSVNHAETPPMNHVVSFCFEQLTKMSYKVFRVYTQCHFAFLHLNERQKYKSVPLRSYRGMKWWSNELGQAQWFHLEHSILVKVCLLETKKWHAWTGPLRFTEHHLAPALKCSTELRTRHTATVWH